MNFSNLKEAFSRTGSFTKKSFSFYTSITVWEKRRHIWTPFLKNLPELIFSIFRKKEKNAQSVGEPTHQFDLGSDLISLII